MLPYYIMFSCNQQSYNWQHNQQHNRQHAHPAVLQPAAQLAAQLAAHPATQLAVLLAVLLATQLAALGVKYALELKQMSTASWRVQTTFPRCQFLIVCYTGSEKQ